MSEYKIIGLSEDEAARRKTIGLSNTSIDTYSPTYLKILINNTFTIMTVALMPMAVALLLFGIYREVAAIVVFIVISSILNTLEEIRIKKRLDKLKTRFQNRVRVIRDSIEKDISADNVVEGDFVVAGEGDGIVADGLIMSSEFLQLDESSLTGESNYINKEKGEGILSGSFVVTGKCIYQVQKVGEDNFYNKLSAKSTQFKEHRSGLEKNSRNFILLFSLLGLVASIINLVGAKLGDSPTADILLSITTIITISIPQTLLIVLVLTFIVSITKLVSKGILVQKRGAIDDMSNVDIICIDKTGTITTNEMVVSNIFFNDLDKAKVSTLLYSVHDKLFGQNKTFKTILSYFEHSDITEELLENINNFDQLPFTSKQKFSAFQFNGESLLIGAFNKLINNLNLEHNSEVLKWFENEELKGRRVLVGAHFKEAIIKDLRENKLDSKTNSFFLISIEEELNPGIHEVIKNVQDLGIEIKVISGDSLKYVGNISKAIGINNSEGMDLSLTQSKLTNDDVNQFGVFARATPEQKAEIIKLLQESGKKVAMIGDGVNDVIGLKQSNIGISMESGAKIARDSADIVLLENDYTKIPEIFYEGDNIVFNVRQSIKMFFARTIMIAVLSIYFSIREMPIPILPTTTLIASFLGSTLPGYLLTFTRQKVRNKKDFNKDILSSSVPTGILLGILMIISYLAIEDKNLSKMQVNTLLVLIMLGINLTYTLYLLWESKKIKRDLRLIFVTFMAAIVFGAFQTILPISMVTALWEKIVTIVLVVFTAIGINIISRYVSHKSLNKKSNKVGNIISIGFIPFALLYPSRLYYAAEPVGIIYYGLVFAISAICFALIVLLHRVINR
jgi:cation-transporting ATPase E